MKSCNRPFLRAFFALLHVSAALQAQPLFNGSFEAPIQFRNGLYANTLPTTWTGNPPFLFRGEADSSVWPRPQDGEQFIDLGFGEGAFTISQVVRVTTSGNYRLQWYHNTAIGFGPGRANYRAAVLDSSMSVLQEGLFDPGNAGTWQRASLTVPLNVGIYTIRFTSGPLTGLDTLLDNVTLTIVDEEIVRALQPIQDTYVQDSSPFENFGMASSLIVGNRSFEFPQQSISYVTFDATSVPGDITLKGARLRIFLTPHEGTGEIAIYSVNGDYLVDTRWYSCRVVA